ncbi:hypothetical protein IAE22_33095, partial [Bacillus sp. S34]|nr:hypothetical protein [Bacillus sp. S34]
MLDVYVARGEPAGVEQDLGADLRVHGPGWESVVPESMRGAPALTRAEVAALAEGIDLQLWWEAIDAPAGAFSTVVVREPSFVTGLAELLRTEAAEQAEVHPV